MSRKTTHPVIVPAEMWDNRVSTIFVKNNRKGTPEAKKFETSRKNSRFRRFFKTDKQCKSTMQIKFKYKYKIK